MEKSSKILYDVYVKHWTETGIFKGPPAISKGLSEFLRECANYVYWQELYKYHASDEWNKFKNMLEELAEQIENDFLDD